MISDQPSFAFLMCKQDGHLLCKLDISYCDVLIIEGLACGVK